MTSQEWTIDPCAENVTRLRHAIVDYSRRQGLQAGLVDDVALAVSEVATNAVVHAFRAGGDGTITMVASVDDGVLRIRVADDGTGLTPRDTTSSAGLGLAIAGRVADDLEIERLRSGTAVSLTFAATA